MLTARSFADLTDREKAIELLRWLAVLPAAILATNAIHFVITLVVRVAMPAIWFPHNQSDLLYYLQLLLYYSTKKVGFVIVGAVTAPRHHLAVSVVLAVIAILLSLTVHVWGQSNPGDTNYSHFAAESIGALVGAACMFYFEVRARPLRSPIP